jgi:transglutaminase-like putative cysteine protease
VSTRVEQSWFADGSRRALALAATALLMASYLSVLHNVTVIAGETSRLVLFVAGSLLAATLLARFLPAVLALALTAGLFVVGLWGYIQAVPNGELLLQSLGAVRADILSLLTGLSILRIMEAGVWAVGFAPAPTFLTWYFALRRRYVAAAVVGGAALGFFVLTGDASTTIVLAGMVGAAGVVGFGELERHDGGVKQAETLVVVLAAMVVLAPLVSVVPGGASDPLVPSGGGGPATVETSLLRAGDQVTIQGSITLSPKVRFTVESNRQSYWRVAGYDRYTGQGWVRTGDTRPYNESLPEPPGDATEVEQTYEVETQLGIMPAAWKPTELSDVPTDVLVTNLGGIQPGGQLQNGTRYSIESQRPEWTPDELRSAGQEYPDTIENRYLQLPSSTPERVENRTDRLTANADNPYDTARIIERHLERTKNYSLNVSRPNGNIAASFLFDMQKGYCTYFATTMVTMLRTQGIPARFVTGYTSGQRVAEDEWVVRGLDSHAWVEVYFPDTGWVRFDPTPAGPRTTVEQSNLQNARAGNVSNVDTNQSENGTWTPTPESTPTGGNQNGSGANAGQLNPNSQRRRPPQVARSGPNASNATATPPPTGAGGPGAGGTPGAGDSSISIPDLPSPTREQWAFLLVALVGLAAGARRTGVLGRAYRELWVRFQPSGSPESETERAFERLEYLLARENRVRRSGETPRDYLAAIGADKRATRVGEIFERAHYGGAVTRDGADEASALVDELVRERTPILGRFRRSDTERGPDSI